MNKRVISILKYIALLLVGFGLLWLAFRNVDVRTTFNEIKKANLWWLAASILASLIAFFSRAYRWNMLIYPSGFRPSLMNTSYSLMAGYLANLAIPRLGEVTRCGTLSKIEKVPFNHLIGTVIVERFLDVLCLLALVLFTLYIEYQRLGNFLNENLFVPLKEGTEDLFDVQNLIILSVVVFALIFFYMIVLKSKSSGKRSKFRELMHGVAEGLKSVRKLKNPWAFVFHTILIWLMYFFMSYTCFFALASTSGLDWRAGLFILVAGGMGMSAPVQGGIGAYHILVSQGLILYGIAYQNGLAFATLMHASQTLLVLILGGLSFLMIAINERKKTNENTGLNQK